MSIPDYYRKVLKINLRLIMQLLIQPFHFMSNVENGHVLDSVNNSYIVFFFSCALTSSLNGLGNNNKEM